MAARKSTPKKKAAPRRAAPRTTAAARARAEQARFERQNDLGTLQRADEVKRDPARMQGAQREARDQRKALERVAKEPRPRK